MHDPRVLWVKALFRAARRERQAKVRAYEDWLFARG